MRIAGLHLRAYGHFTDHKLDFGANPGLHLVYGANESGKSTTLRALSSVLFGYPSSIVDGFRHGSKDMAIGADLIAQDNRRLSYVRRRRGKNALSSQTGAALDESAVTAFLGGASKDVFEKVFALDHRRLHDHAQALLADGGSLGFSLAEAGSGIAGLKTLLENLEDERADLFLGSGANPRINALIRKLAELRKEASRRTVSPHEYKKLEREIKSATETLREARERQQELEADIRRLERIGKNLTRRVEHEALSRRIDELSSVPLLPSEAVQARIKAQSNRDGAQTGLTQAEKAIEELEAKVEAVALDESVLTHREHIERLATQRSLMQERKDHLPRREAERRQLVENARELLAKGELSGDPEDLGKVLPSALKRKSIETASARGAKLRVQRASADEQLKKAEKELEAAAARAEKAPKPRDSAELSMTLTAADRLGDITSTIAQRSRALQTKATRLKQSIVGLGVSSGDITELRELVVPPEPTVERYAESLARLDKEAELAGSDCERLDGEIADLDDRIAQVRTGGDVPSEGDLAAARGARDEGWGLIRGLFIERCTEMESQVKAFAPDGRIAEAYERRVAGADQVVDAMRTHAEKVTELSLLEHDRADRVSNRAEAQTRLETAQQRHLDLLEEWKSLWPRGAIKPLLPREMMDWLNRRAGLLADAEDIEDERDSIEELTRKEQEAVRSLAQTLQAFGTAADASSTLDALRDQARQLLGELMAADTRHEKAKEAVWAQGKLVTDSNSALAELDGQIEAWEPQWRAALEAAGITPTLTVEGASVVLGIMSELDVVKSKADELKHRVSAMQSDLDGFAAEIGALAHLAPNAPSTDSVEICRLLEARLKEAVAADTERRSLNKQLGIQITARDKAKDALAGAEKELDALCKQAGCADPDELPDIESKSAEKQQAIRDRTELEKRMREDGAGLSLEELFAECDGMIGDELPGKVADLDREREDVGKTIEDLMQSQADKRAEFDRLLAQDQAAEILQQAANVEAELVEAVEAYVDLTLQELLLRRSIDLYRERNEGPVLGRAKELFVTLTDGAYTGLRADLDEKKQPILLAEHRTRGSLEMDALSDGTVDSLYLALRLAVVQEHNATREPLPFIADDLLLNLDNDRTMAAFRTLAQVAQSGQVLFFTHHAHMVELARTTMPKDLLIEHRLPEPSQVAE